MDDYSKHLKNNINKYKLITVSNSLIYLVTKFIFFSLVLLSFLILIDNIFHLSNEWRSVCFILCCCYTIFFIYYFQKKLNILDKINYPLQYEAINNHLNNTIVNAISFIKHKKQTPITKRIIYDAYKLTTFFNYVKLTNKKQLPLKIISSLTVILLISFYSTYYQDYYFNGIKRIFLPYKQITPATRTKIEHNFKNNFITMGETHAINFTLIKGKQNKAIIKIQKSPSNKVSEEIIFKNKNNSFTYTFQEVRNSISWQIQIGDYYSKKFFIQIIPPPKIKEISLIHTPPTYLHQKDSEIIFQNQILNLLKASYLNIALSLANQCESINISYNSKMYPMKQLTKNKWHGTIKITTTGKIGFVSQAPDIKQNKLDMELHVNAIVDKKPIIQITDNFIRLNPDQKIFSIVSVIEDDFNIKDIQLKYLSPDEKLWNIFHSDPKIKTTSINKKWSVNLQKIKLPDNFSSLKFRISANDYNEKNQYSQSPIIEITKLSDIQYDIELIKDMITLNKKMKNEISNILLNNTTNAETKATLVSFINLLQEKIVKLSRRKLSNSKLFIFKKDIISILQTLNNKKSLSTINDRIFLEIISLITDMQNINKTLIRKIINKELQSFIKKLKSNNSLSDYRTFSIYNSYHEIVKELTNLSNWLKSKNDSQTTLTKQTKIINNQKLLNVLKTMDNSVSNSDQKTFAINLQQSKKIINSIFDKLILMNLPQDKLSTENVYPVLEKIVLKLTQIKNTIQKLIINEQSNKEKIFFLIKLFEKALIDIIHKITQLQKNYPSVGIKGTTLLKASIFDLKESLSLIQNNQYKKTMSKLKKATSNIATTSSILSSLIKTDKIKQNFVKTKIIPKQKTMIKASISLPTPSLVVLPSAIVPVNIYAASPKGLMDIWLNIKITNINKSLTKSIHINNYPELPEKRNFNFELDLSLLQIEMDSTLEITTTVIDNNTENFNKINSEAVSLKVFSPLKNINIEKYYQLKNEFSYIFETILKIQQQIYEDFIQYENNIVNNKIDIDLINRIYESQNILTQKYQTSLNKLTDYYNLNYDFPEKDFKRYYYFAKDSTKITFTNLLNLIFKINYMQANNPNIEMLHALSIEAKIIFQNILSYLKELQSFFGIPLSKIALKTSEGEEIFNLINHLKELRNNILNIQNNRQKAAEKHSQIEVIIKKQIHTLKKNKIHNYFDKFETKLLSLIKTKIESDINLFINQLIIFIHKTIKKLELKLSKSLYNTLEKEVKNLSKNKKETNKKEISTILNSLKTISQTPFTTELFILDQNNPFEDQEKSKNAIDNNTQLSNELSPFLLENSLNIWKKITLLENKFNILKGRLDQACNKKIVNFQQINYLKQLGALMKIFFIQLEEVAESVSAIETQEEKEKAQQKIKNLHKIKINLVDINKQLLNKIQNSFYHFEKEYQDVVTEKIKILVKNKITIHNYMDLQDYFYLYCKKFSEIFPLLEITSTTHDSKIKPLQKLIQLTSDLSRTKSEKVFTNRIKIIESSVGLLKKLILLELLMKDSPSNSIIGTKILHQVKENKYNLLELIMNATKQISKKLNHEQIDLQIVKIQTEIEKYAQKIKTLKNEIISLKEKLNISKKDLDKLDNLQKQIIQYQMQIDSLKNRIKNIKNSNSISFITYNKKITSTPKQSKVLFKELDAINKKVQMINNNTEESLDALIFRSFTEELEELEESSFQNQNKTVDMIKQELATIGINTDAYNIKTLQKDIKNKETTIKKKEQATMISDILNNLNKASNNLDSITNPTSEMTAPSAKKIRYLDNINKTVESFKRVQDKLGHTHLTKKSFNQILSKQIMTIESQTNELRTMNPNTDQYSSLLQNTIKNLKEVEFNFSNKPRISFIGNSLRTHNKNKLVIKSLFSKAIAGYEELTKEYFLAVSEK